MTFSRVHISVLIAIPLAVPHVCFAAAPSDHAAVPARYLNLFAPVSATHDALQADPSKPKAVDPLPDGKGKDVVKRVCSGCHAVTVFSQQRHTPERWASLVDSMVAKGMDASDDEITTITNYLSTNLAEPKQDSPAAPSPQAPSNR